MSLWWYNYVVVPCFNWKFKRMWLREGRDPSLLPTVKLGRLTKDDIRWAWNEVRKLQERGQL